MEVYNNMAGKRFYSLHLAEFLIILKKQLKKLFRLMLVYL